MPTATAQGVEITVQDDHRLVTGMEVIPDIESNQGRSWRQPIRTRITFEVSADDSMPIIKLKPEKAYMFKTELDQLSEYSRSTPTGVYPGKMWRAEWKDEAGNLGHYLVWFEDSSTHPGTQCAIKYCPILLLDTILLLNPQANN